MPVIVGVCGWRGCTEKTDTLEWCTEHNVESRAVQRRERTCIVCGGPVDIFTAVHPGARQRSRRRAEMQTTYCPRHARIEPIVALAGSVAPMGCGCGVYGVMCAAHDPFDRRPYQHRVTLACGTDKQVVMGIDAIAEVRRGDKAPA